MQDTSDSGPARSIRSYVIRTGRITTAQQRALTDLWPRYGVTFESQTLDLERLFGRRAACTLEIGFGNGENLAARAAREPQRDFLGVEVHRPGVGHLLLAAAGAGLTNLRVIAHDAVEVLERQLAPECLDEVQLLFPDPWPKKRHHKRRLVQSAFIALVASRLRPAGRLHVATDWQPYAEQMALDLSACTRLDVGIDAGCARDMRVSTRFERRGERLGHRIHEFVFVKNTNA